MTVAAPARNRDQRLAALRKANRVRVYRAAVKRQLAAGSGQVTLFIASPPDEIHSMKLRDLLLALPKLGHVKVDRILRELQISPRKTVGGLSDRQRKLVLAHFHEVQA